MEPRSAVGLVLVSVMVAALPVPALGLFDDDAGSGGDAGDLPAWAVPVAEGTVGGRVQSPHDPADVYAFEGEARQWVHLRFDAEGPVALALHEEADLPGLPHAVLFPGEGLTYLLPFAASWYLVVRPMQAAPPGEVLPYDFSLRFSMPAQVVLVEGAAGWETAEIALREPTRFVLTTRSTRDATPSATPSALLTLEQVDLRLEGQQQRGVGATYLGGAGVGDTIAVEPLGLRRALPSQPGPALGVGPALAGEGVTFTTDLVTHDVTAEGRLRLAAADAATNGGVLLAFSADRPFDLRVANGTSLIVWTGGSAEADVGLVVPGASVVGPRDFPVDVGGVAFGAFSPGPYRGWFTPPGEDAVVLDLMDSAFFFGAAAGPWQFHLEPTVGVGPWASAPQLVLAEVPALGLVPPWRDGVEVWRSVEPATLLPCQRNQGCGWA